MQIKHIIGSALLTCCVAFTSCQSSTTEKKEQVNENFTEEVMDTTVIQFDTTFHAFGVIEQGEKVSHTFNFTNTGDKDLVLKSVKASCGCTVPEWTKEPVSPGNTGTIEVEFNSAGRKGKQQKTITVVSNTDPKVIYLKFTAEVNAPEVSK